MIPRTPPDPQPTRLRRRVIVELTPDEVPLLEAAERRHGTKRQAVVAALAALAAAPHRRTSERPRAGPGPARSAGRRGRASPSATALADALSRAEAERDEARGAARRLGGASPSYRLGPSPSRRRSARRSRPLRPHGPLPSTAPAASMGPEAEWAWRTSEVGAGQVAYHAPCGDHGPGLVGLASWLARRGTPRRRSPPGKKPVWAPRRPRATVAAWHRGPTPSTWGRQGAVRAAPGRSASPPACAPPPLLPTPAARSPTGRGAGEARQRGLVPWAG